MRLVLQFYLWLFICSLFPKSQCNLDQRKIEARDFVLPPSFTPKHLRVFSKGLFQVDECQFYIVSNLECFCPAWQATPSFPVMEVHDLAFNAFYFYYKPIDLSALQFSLYKNFLLNNPILIEKELADFSQDHRGSLPRSRIPKLVHLLWVTDPENPHPYPQKYIRIMMENSKVTLSRCCTVFLWSNVDQAKIPSFSQLQSVFFRSTFKNLKEIEGEFLPKTKEMMKQLFLTKQFSRIADIYRIYILKKQGGLYLDADVHFYKPIDPLFENFDSVNLRIQLPILAAVESFFFAYKPNHPILDNMVEFLEELDGKSAVIPIVNEIAIEYFTQIPMFWALASHVYFYENRNNLELKDLMLEFNLGIRFMSHDNDRSWKKGGFGQVSDSFHGFTMTREEYKEHILRRLEKMVKTEIGTN